VSGSSLANKAEHSPKNEKANQLIEYPEHLIWNINRTIDYRMGQVPQRCEKPETQSVFQPVNRSSESHSQGEELVGERKENAKKQADQKFRPNEIECVDLLGCELARRSELGPIDNPRQDGTSDEQLCPHCES